MIRFYVVLRKTGGLVPTGGFDSIDEANDTAARLRARGWPCQVEAREHEPETLEDAIAFGVSVLAGQRCRRINFGGTHA